MKLVYITGCLGFMGSHLTRKVLQRGWYVRGIDSMTYASQPKVLEEFKSYDNIEDLGEKNFYDLSKCLKELDIIVSSDTSIIHLCGILNIKAYMLLNYNSDWRWFFDEERTFWYPSIKIIKQKKINEWSFVFEKLEAELMNLYNNKFKA